MNALAALAVWMVTFAVMAGRIRNTFFPQGHQENAENDDSAVFESCTGTSRNQPEGFQLMRHKDHLVAA
jgi:hypothetical protein